MRGKITKRAVDGLRASSGGAVLLWDADLPGFGVRCRASGAKYYVVKFRTTAGRPRWVTIGRHGAPWTPDAARKEALRLLGQVAAGQDPASEREAMRRDLTIAELCDVYVAEGCTTKKSSTLIVDRSSIERHIKPLLGRRRAREVTRADVERFQQDVANGKTATDVRTKVRGRAIVSGGRGTAARAVGVLGAIFSVAVRRELRPDNPVKGVKLFERNKRERFLSTVELARLGDALTAAKQGGENPFAIAALRLLALTGARKSEILGLRWEWVDFERRCLRLPDSKTGAKVVPLGAPALELLASLPRVEGNPHVLPSARADGHFVGLQKVWARVRKRAGLDGVRVHDLRHSFASVAVAGGDSLYLVGKVLGHRQARTTEVYAHLHDDPVRAVADRAASAIEAAMSREAGDGTRVVPLARGSAHGK